MQPHKVWLNGAKLWEITGQICHLAPAGLEECPAGISRVLAVPRGMGEMLDALVCAPDFKMSHNLRIFSIFPLNKSCFYSLGLTGLQKHVLKEGGLIACLQGQK